MDKRRDKIIIINDTLENVEKESKITEIMRNANLSFSQWKIYRNFLLKKELMTEKNNGDNRKVYVITDKGKEVLKRYEELKRYFA